MPSVKDMKDQIAQLEVQIEAIRGKIEAFRIVVAHYESLGQDAEPKSIASGYLHDMMENILEQESKPLHYTIVYRRLVEQGIAVAGQKPERNVGAHLSSDKRFEPIGKRSGLWGLKKWRNARPAHIGDTANEASKLLDIDTLFPSDTLKRVG